ncbi:MAG: hypothetical protein ACRCTD_10115 [Beijerinckiaceae bacterium]
MIMKIGICRIVAIAEGLAPCAARAQPLPDLLACILNESAGIKAAGQPGLLRVNAPG